MGANLILPSSSPADDAEVVTKSLRMSGAGVHLDRQWGTPTDRNTWTFSCWVKLGDFSNGIVLLSSSESNGTTGMYPSLTLSILDGGQIYASGYNGSAYNIQCYSDRLLRDFSAWYHITASYEDGGSGEDFKMWVNGERVTWSSAVAGPTFPASADLLPVNNSGKYATVGMYSWNQAANYAGEYLADVYFIDGAAVDPNDNFIETDTTTGQIKPKAYTVSGDNSFHLDFKVAPGTGDGAGTDVSGNDNHFAATGLASSDQMNDRPTNNYGVWNPLSLGSGGTLTEGNLELATSSSGYANCYSTIAMGESNDTQKYYAEFYVTDAAFAIIGMATLAAYDTSHVGNNNESWGYYQDGTLRWGSWATPGSNDPYSNGEIIGVMYDASADTITFYNEGVAQTYGFSSTQNLDTKKPLVFAMSDAHGSGTAGAVANYGQDPAFAGNKTSGQDTSQSEFYYAPPTGAVALSTANLPTATIAKGHKYFNTLLYNDGTGAKTFGAADNLSPDLVWVKSRGSSNNHKLTDSLRGVQKSMESDTIDAEVTESSNVGVTVFGADGFTIGSSSSTTGPYADQTGTGMVGWGWKSATVGSGGSGVNWAEQYDATAGISIVKWSGNSSVNTSGNEQTISHYNHGDTAMIIAKARTAHGVTESMDTGGWIVWHKDLTSEDYFLTLNTTSAQDYWSSSYMKVISDITDTSIKVGNGNDYNYGNPYALNFDGSGSWTDVEDYIGYFFSEVAGYSKFGSYEGTNAGEPGTPGGGPFVWCGFKPRWIMIKAISGTYATVGWVIIDTARSSYNIERSLLLANSSAVEDTTANADVDILSNGFKPRYTPNETNGNNTYIFAAFAESPFKYSSAR